MRLHAPRPLWWLFASGVLLVFLSVARAAEPGADDTFLRDYAETRGFMLGRPVNATPTPDGSAVLFLRAHAAREPSQELYEFSVATGQTRRLLSPEDALKGAAEQLSSEEKARRERQRISVGGFTAFSISRDSALVLLSLSGKLYVLHRADGKVIELATGPGVIVDPKFSPDSRSVAYVRDQDVCVLDLASGKEHAVTTGGTETVSHGLAEFVAQEEMNRFSGYWWSPDSSQIVYQESDASKVEVWYAADPAQPGNPPEKSFYPRPGKENVSVRVGVVSAIGQDAPTKWLEWDRAHYSYLGKVTWTEHGPLTLTVLSRDQTDLALLKADPTTGETSILLTEHDDAWVNFPQDVPVWLSEQDGGGFLWASDERQDKRTLEHRADTGRLYTVVQPNWADDFVTLDATFEGRVYGTFSYHSPMADFSDSLPLGGSPNPGGHSQPPSEPSLNRATFGDSKTIYAVQEQTLDKMPRSLVRRASDGTLVGELPSIALNPPFTPKTTFETVQRTESIPDHDENIYYTVLTEPRDSDPAAKRKYPVIVDVYGGPDHQQVVASMRPYLLDQWLADQGFIVVAIDGRGTPRRGRQWERAVAGHFGSVPLDDQVEALQELGQKHPEMDMDRVGITGWSFGGYMSALAVLRRPDIFKAAVAGAPVVDWMDYDTCYTERYLGVPGAGLWPDAYKEGSLLTYADGLSRPLLLIHGTADDNVYFRHSLRLAQELFRAGKPFDFLPLSSFTHMVPDPVVRVRLEERIVRYFREHL